MAEVYPFIGTRYNSQLIGNLGKVVCPPCDAVSDELQAGLYERHEHNAVRLERARAESEDDNFSNRFTRAANTLATWRSDGVVIEDEKPSFYLVEQVFQGSDGSEERRVGFMAKVKLEENTPIEADGVELLTGARADHLELIRSTNANISGVSAVFSDADGAVRQVLDARMKERPWEELVDDHNVQHRLWVVQKKDLLLSLVDALKPRELFIAEGRNRYVAAQIYRDEMRVETGKSDGKQAFDYVMMMLLPAEQPGLYFSAMHRGLTKAIMADVNLKDALVELGDCFDVRKEKVNLAEPEAEAARLLRNLAEIGAEQPAFTMVHASGTAYHLTLSSDAETADFYDDPSIPECVSSLDACILHNFIINQVLIGNPEYELEDDECIYVESGEQLLALLASKKIVCGFLLNAPSVPRMLDLANEKAAVPLEMGVLSPRSCSGLVLRNLQTDMRKAPRK